MNKKKILVIDDDEGIVDALEIALDEEGYEAKSIKEGDYLKEVFDYEPDVILLDVILAGNDGRDIVETLKKHPDTNHIPIIMMSAHPHVGEETIEHGADEFLEKPFDIDEMMGLIQKHI